MVRFGALGDTVLLTAMLADLARRWGAPCDVVTGAGPQRRVLAGLESVGQVVTLASRRRPYPLAPAQWALVGRLRRRGVTPTYLFDKLPKIGWLAGRAGIPPRCRLATLDTPRGLLEHTLDYQRRWTRELPEAWAEEGPPPPAGPPAEPEIAVPETDREACRRWVAESGWEGRPLVLIQSQSRRRNRGRWPERSWAAAAAGVLAELPEARVLLLGAPAEHAEVETLRRACADPRVVNVAAELPLDRLFALLTLAHSCLSLDSGPAHAAAALGCPVVVLPGHADPRRNRPPGPTDRVQIVAEAPPDQWPPDPYAWARWHRLDAVTPDVVLNAWRALSS